MVSHWLGPTAALTCFAPKPFRGGPRSKPCSPPKLAPESPDLGLCNLLPSRWDPDELQGGVRFAYIYGLEAGPAQDIIPLMPKPAKESGALGSHPSSVTRESWISSAEKERFSSGLGKCNRK